MLARILNVKYINRLSQLLTDEYELYEYYASINWSRNVGVNDKCLCESNIKYKKCCKSKNNTWYNYLKEWY